MKLIKPSEISAKILTLLHECDERVIIVSPYMKISKWYKLVNKLNELKSRNILVDIYVRDDPGNTDTYHDLDSLKFQYMKVPHLHSKFYMNEKLGIMTSMNLLLYSEINSLEIGCVTENRRDYSDLLAYYNRYIHKLPPGNEVAGETIADPRAFKHSICDDLKENHKNSWLWFEKNTLHICTVKNYYRSRIDKGYLIISVNLKNRAPSSSCYRSSQKYRHLPFTSTIKTENLTDMMIEIHKEPGTDTVQINGQSLNLLRSKSITGPMEDETDYVLNCIRNFIIATDDLSSDT